MAPGTQIVPRTSLRDHGDKIIADINKALGLAAAGAGDVIAVLACTGAYDDHIVAFSQFDQVPIYGPCGHGCTVPQLH